MARMYASLADVKDRLDITDTADDLTLSAAIMGVSDWIEHYTGRRFIATSETRYYTAQSGTIVLVDDVLSVSTLTTDDNDDRTYSTSWASTDYDLMPYNAGTDGEPYTWIEATRNGNYRFNLIPRGVGITGVFGYTLTPPFAIVEAATLATMRLWKRKDAIFGVAGAPALGVQVVAAQIQQDADVLMLLMPYVRTYS